MHTIQSRDGTTIAYDVVGNGSPVVLVAGALCSRNSWSGGDLARLLAPQFTVYNYDRRGRGDSGDTQPYAVEREVEDLQTLITAAGGSARLYGHSSGGALALEAALRLGEQVHKLAIYEVPYDDDPAARDGWNQYRQHLAECLTAGRRGDAAALFMHYVGVPAKHIERARNSPGWPAIEAIAPTLAYDNALLGENRSIPVERVAQVSVPALVLHGGASVTVMHDTACSLAKALPRATLRSLDGQRHNVDVAVLAPILATFFAG